MQYMLLIYSAEPAANASLPPEQRFAPWMAYSKALREAKEEAERANRAKDRFLAVLSHELRTPLTVIRTATERLGMEPGLSDAARRHVDHIAQSSLHLEQTVALLLSLAREQTSTEAALSVPVLPLLERVIVEQSPLLEHKPVEVQVDVATDVVATLPATVLNILLSNLVGNAFAHTRGGRIVIDMEGRTLRIANPGHGVREEDFAPFAKGADSNGFGLGLSIVRRLCERHGIALRIDGVSGQTVARLTLPAT